MAIRENPYRVLQAIAPFELLVAYDHNVGFAHTNIGVLSVRNVTPHASPTLALLRAVEQRVLQVLALPPPTSRREFARRLGELWDQNVFNKVLEERLSAGHSIVPPGVLYRRAQLLARRDGVPLEMAWMQSLGWEPRLIPTPPPLATHLPWYPAESHCFSRPLGGDRAAMARTPDARVHPRVALAPQWLVSMENGLGVKWRCATAGAAPL